MNKLKDILKSSLISMMMSFTIFVIVGMIFDLTGGGTFHMENHGFTKMAFACMITGLGFGVPSVLYSMEQLPMPLASVLHLGTGFAIYFIAATYVGWIPTSAGIPACIATVIGVFVVGILIWIGFMKYNKKMAERINSAIREKQKNL